MTAHVIIKGWKENFPTSIASVVKGNTLSEIFTKFVQENSSTIQLMEFEFVTEITFQLKPQLKQLL